MTKATPAPPPEGSAEARLAEIDRAVAPWLDRQASSRKFLELVEDSRRHGWMPDLAAEQMTRERILQHRLKANGGRMSGL